MNEGIHLDLDTWIVPNPLVSLKSFCMHPGWGHERVLGAHDRFLNLILIDNNYQSDINSYDDLLIRL